MTESHPTNKRARGNTSSISINQNFRVNLTPARRQFLVAAERVANELSAQLAENTRCAEEAHAERIR